jgi:hypothetical protein
MEEQKQEQNYDDYKQEYDQEQDYDQEDAVPAELVEVVLDGVPTILVPENTSNKLEFLDAYNVAYNAEVHGVPEDEEAAANRAATSAFIRYALEQNQLQKEAQKIVEAKAQQGEQPPQVVRMCVRFECVD